MTDNYDSNADVWASVDYAYQVIRERKANGGPGWIPSMSYQRKEVLAEGVEVYLGDCIKLLPSLPKADALVTDPPYGIGDKMQGGTWGAAEKYEDFRDWDVAPTPSEIALLCRSADAAIIWGGNYFELPASRCWLIWLKQNAVHTMADFEMAWTNLDRPAKIYRGPVGVHVSGHPTEKPLALMRWCLDFIPEANTILDPYMGSGTTGVAAIKRGKKFIGIERRLKYFEIALRRISRALSEPDLFIESPPPPKQEKLAL